MERFFHGYFTDALGLNEDDIKGIFSRVPIVHVHGRIGGFSWESEYLNKIPGYVGLTENLILNVRDKISVFSENEVGPHDDGLVNDSHTDQVVFLGFSFNSANLPKLFGKIQYNRERDRFEYSSRCKRFLVNAYSFEAGERMRLRSFFGPDIEIEYIDGDCTDLLKKSRVFT